MLSRILMKKNAEGRGSILEINGVDAAPFVVSYTMSGKGSTPPEFVLFMRGEVDLDVEGVVYLVAPPKQSDVFKQAAAFLRQADPKNLEELALERMQWGENQTLSNTLIEAIIEVFEDAANQLEPTEEVHRNPDGGLRDDHEEPGNG